MRLSTYNDELSEQSIRGVMESHRQEMVYEGYDPSLEFVAEEDDQTLAAYCGGSLDPKEWETTGQKDGWTDPVGTANGHRRKGLARACVLPPYAP